MFIAKLTYIVAQYITKKKRNSFFFFYENVRESILCYTRVILQSRKDELYFYVSLWGEGRGGERGKREDRRSFSRVMIRKASMNDTFLDPGT